MTEQDITCLLYTSMPSPEGYRKALRLMKQAEKFHRPIITFIDTPGAFCGIEAEERGQGEAIARKMCIRDRYFMCKGDEPWESWHLYFRGKERNMWEWEKIFMKNFLFADRL